MTTFPSEAAGGGGLRPPRCALPPGYLGPREGTLAVLALALALALAGAAPRASAQEMTLPSGLAATLYDVVLEGGAAVLAPDAYTDPEAQAALDLGGDEPLNRPPEGDAGGAGGEAPRGLARFRLTVPGLGGEGAGFEVVAGDFAWLCEAVALPSLAANDWTPAEVVIALSDREVPFGATDPQAVQFFEGFRIADGSCIPQAF